MTVGKYYESIWIKRQVVPAVRPSAAKRHRWTFESTILPVWRHVPLSQITLAALVDFRARLFERKVRDRPISLKTVRNISDWHFRALSREARDIDHLVTANPFAELRWPKPPRKKPDPFTEAERDTILGFFARKRPHWYPFVYFQFWTGCRPSETAALRVSDVDLTLGRVSITKSRDEQYESAPRTEGSVREIKLLPNVLAVLRAMPKLLHADEDTYFFRNPDGGPITTTWWKKSWYPVLQVLGVRPRKFYATRHTFISVALSTSCNLKWVAEYCGTSVAMIEKSYGKFIADDGAAPLIRSLRGEMRTFRIPSAASVAKYAATEVVPGGIERQSGAKNESREAVEDAKKTRDSRQASGSRWLPQVPQNDPKGGENSNRFEAIPGCAGMLRA
jgi:integrase